MEGYCSPSHEKNMKENGTCFSKKALVRIAKSWNESGNGNRIVNMERKSIKELWRDINQRMTSICGNKNETCWADKLNAVRPSQEVMDSLAPKRPADWYKNPRTWLTNFDIENVMLQYDITKDPQFKYKFLGVYPIDFQASSFGQCLFREICALEIVPLYKKGIRYVGLITNLDKHDQDGSHWTSTFIVLDPKSPAFGVWYYDSVFNIEPTEITAFKDSLRHQVEAASDIFDKKTFITNMDRSVKYRHQYQNTECGMFSIDYQVRWLKALKKSPMKTTFKDIVDISLDDEKVYKLRYKYYRGMSGGKK